MAKFRNKLLKSLIMVLGLASANAETTLEEYLGLSNTNSDSSDVSLELKNPEVSLEQILEIEDIDISELNLSAEELEQFRELIEQGQHGIDAAVEPPIINPGKKSKSSN